MYEAEKNSESVLAARAPRQTQRGEVTVLKIPHTYTYTLCSKKVMPKFKSL